MKRGVLFLYILILALPFLHAQDLYEPDGTYTNATWIPTNGTFQQHNFTVDDQDWVKFNATAGHVYVINTTNHTPINITDTQIELYSTDGTTLLAENDDIKLGVTRTSEIVWRATQNGTYYVKIFEWSNSGGGEYGIRVEQQGILQPYLITPNTSSTAYFNNTFNITTGVLCKGGPCTNVKAILDPQEQNASEHLSVIVTFKEDNYLPKIESTDSKEIKHVKLKTREKLLERKANIIARSTGATINKTSKTVPIFTANVTKDEIKKLLERDDIINVEIDRPIAIMLDTSVASINADNITYKGLQVNGSGETVCVIDTGIAYTHADFGSCAQTANISDGSCPTVIGGYDFVNGDNDPMDDNGHGSHVAGIIASRDPTYTGVAPGVKLVAIKALNSAGGGSLSNAVLGVDWCVAHAAELNISVITMSLGDPTYHSSMYCDREDTSMSAAINSARAQGIIVTVASGNEGKGASGAQGISDPGCVENATSVGSTDDGTTISSFTNRGLTLDLLAPGEAITSTAHTGGHRVDSGTSMATPHVAGLSALLIHYFKLNYNRSLEPENLEHILKFSGQKILDSATGLTFPRINAASAIQFKGAVPTTIGAEPFYTTSPNPVSCGDLNDGDSCNTTWQVIPTRKGTYEFFTIYTGFYQEIDTPHFNLTTIIPTINFTVEKTSNTSNAGLNASLFYTITITNYENESINVTLEELFSNSSLLFTNTSENHTNYVWNFTLNASQNKTITLNAQTLTDGTINNTARATATSSLTTITKQSSALVNITDITAPQVHNISIKGPKTVGAKHILTLNATENTAIDTAIISINASTLNTTNLTLNATLQTLFIPNASDNYTLRVFVNDTTGNINDSFTTTLQVLPDDDGDGIADTNDTIKGNVSSINATGITTIQLYINGSLFNNTQNPSENTTIELRKGTTPFINFTYDFTTPLNLSNITLIQSGDELVINLGVNTTKTVLFDDNSYDSLCVKDAITTTTGTLSADCTGQDEYDLTPCLGNSSTTTVAHILCEDMGNTIKLSNLTHTAIKGTKTTTSSNSGGSSGGGGGSGGSSKSIIQKVVLVTPSTTTQTVTLQSGNILRVVLDSGSYDLTFTNYGNGVATLKRFDGGQVGLLKGISFDIDITGDAKKDLVVLFDDSDKESILEITLYRPLPRTYPTLPLPKQKRENASIITQEEQTSQEIIEKIAETSSPDQQEENNNITQELTQESTLEENLTQSAPYKTIATILLVLIIGVLAYKTPRKRLLKKEPKKKTIEDEIEQELRRI
ncbi:hypothetical protein D6774_01350 [Candidatus Woesearchaeota archaeon]|nr:MAG: hypothetical protein D6774_01350 [Candidatus Woesearchaeota archaeon]